MKAPAGLPRAIDDLQLARIGVTATRFAVPSARSSTGERSSFRHTHRPAIVARPRRSCFEPPRSQNLPAAEPGESIQRD